MAGSLRSQLGMILEHVSPRLRHTWHSYRNTVLYPFERECRMVKALMQPGQAAIDVGANKGYYTWLMSRFATDVAAFEPNPVLAARLRVVLPQHCRVMPYALSSRSGSSVQLCVPHTSAGELEPACGRLIDDDGVREMDEWSPACAYEVETRRLDDFIGAFSHVGLIKIDVEGHERPVIDGGIAFISRYRPKMIIEIEQRHDHQFEKTFDLLYDLKYESFRLSLAAILNCSADIVKHQTREQLGERAAGNIYAYPNNFVFLPTEDRDIFLPKMMAALNGWRAKF
jgi:FkbM family methyltransferase